MANMAKAHARQSKSHKHKTDRSKARPIVVGDSVLRFNAAKKGRKGGPTEPDYYGPYTVIQLKGKRCQLVTTKGTTLKTKYSLDHLKLYRQPSKNLTDVCRACGHAKTQREMKYIDWVKCN